MCLHCAFRRKAGGKAAEYVLYRTRAHGSHLYCICPRNAPPPLYSVSPLFPFSPLSPAPFNPTTTEITAVAKGQCQPSKQASIRIC